MNLLMVPKNTEFKIKKIREKKLERTNQDRHLGNLGFVVGADVSVLSENGGNLIVKVKGTRVAIDNQVASAIMVG